MGIKIKGFNRVASYSGLLLATFFGLITFPISLVIDSTEATVTPSTTTLTLSTSDISAEITPNNTNGTFVASDPATVSITTNNYSGYTLGITSSDNVNNTKLINTDDNTAYLTSISSASSAEEFNTNNWGYLPSKLNGAANSAYQPAPTTTVTTLEVTNAANPTANEYTIALGAKADYTLPEGTYENTFNITAVANPVAYSITYNKNTTDTVTNMPANLIGDTTATTVTISNLVPQRTNYTFLGWNTAADGSGTTYNPNGGGTDLTYDLNQTATNNGTLYAMWEVACNQSATTISNAVCLQDINTSVQNSMTTNTTYQLLDSRDGTNYHLAKLADGRVWLLDNLALDLTDSTVLDNVTAANTNASATSLNYLKNGGGTTSDKYAINGVTNWTSGSSYSAPLVNMDNKDIVPENAPINGAGYNKVGGYYNYCAASAGSYCYGDNTSSAGTSSGDATEDICPAGWRLPTSSASGEFQALATATIGALPTQGYYNDATKLATYRTALSLPFSGIANDGLSYSQGNYGFFWASTRKTDNYMNFLDIFDTHVYPSDYGERFYGIPVRCIAERPDATITFNANGGSGTMSQQTLTKGTGTLNSNTFTREGYAFTGWNTAANGSGTSYADGATYTGTSTTLYAQWQKLYMQNITTATCPTTRTLVYDSRDEKPYYIQKITTGDTTLCWMTSNLNIAGGTTLTSAKSNVSSDYTLPASSTAGFDEINKAFAYNDSTYGGYYSWMAATAGTSPSSGESTYDICPKGWKLPSKTDYDTLKATYTTGTTLTAVPWYGVYGGAYSNSSATIVGSGRYWSSTAAGRFFAYYLGFDSSSASTGSYARSVGSSVRCITQ